MHCILYYFNAGSNLHKQTAIIHFSYMQHDWVSERWPHPLHQQHWANILMNMIMMNMIWVKLHYLIFLYSYFSLTLHNILILKYEYCTSVPSCLCLCNPQNNLELSSFVCIWMQVLLAMPTKHTWDDSLELRLWFYCNKSLFLWMLSGCAVAHIHRVQTCVERSGQKRRTRAASGWTSSS